MTYEEFLTEVENRHDIDDVLNIINKDYSWLYSQIGRELWKFKEDLVYDMDWN